MIEVTALRSTGRLSVSHLVSAVAKATVLIGLTAAVIVGILAMHSFASPTSHSDMGMSADSSTASAISPHTEVSIFATATATADCVGCGEQTSMVLMWCVFALLAVTLLLATPRIVKGWVGAVSRQLSTTSGLRFIEWVPRPPSLTVLCISRT